MLSTQDISGFRNFIYRFYAQAGRTHLPWRMTTDAYAIMVSEIMLQQTQVDRVMPKFEAFLSAFPTLQTLADAPTSAVIRYWQGLGYNRRGLNLQRAAQKVVSDYQGKIPQELEDLLSLPGIGPYTAAAIQTFAFNIPCVVIETNIRTVFIHHFFPEAYAVSDNELKPLIAATVDHENPRLWYGALMDYGSYLKQILPNPTRRSKQYVKQSPLKGSNREVRGKILKVLAVQPLTSAQLLQELNLPTTRIEPALVQLEAEGFVTKIGEIITLSE